MPIVATAAWSIPKTVADQFPNTGSGLTRYASVFDGVEVNSTFYRRHKPATFARWAASVPDDFRFALKMPKDITHGRKMREIGPDFQIFLDDIASLGEKRGPLLCQLPPSLIFEVDAMEGAFRTMRVMDPVATIVIEPRHQSWATAEALALLERYAIDRVLADPAPVWSEADFEAPARYVRLHGSPDIYYSRYSEAAIRSISRNLAAESWCVFDNTASGAAIENALELRAMVCVQRD